MDRSRLGIHRQAEVRRIPLGDDAWVDLVEGFVVDPDALLATVLAEVPWSQGETWRYDRYVEERRLGASLRADRMPDALRQAGLHLDATYRVRFGGDAVAIQYRDGTDFQGLHSDREMRWLDDTLIAIVVLGARRPFVLRPRGDWRDPDARRDTGHDVVLTPGQGDLLVMGGAAQRDWLHGVPAAPEVREPRVSVTWRWTSRRGRPDTAPGYMEGRHFSDRRGGPGRRTKSA